MIVMVFDKMLPYLASAAISEQMMRGWGWILLASNVPTAQIQGWLYLRPFLPSEGMQAFAKQVSDYTKLYFNVTTSPELVDLTYSVALHDAVMLYAHAATKVLSEGGSLQDGHAVTAAVRSTTFKGVGNRTVALDENGDRIESYEMINYLLGTDSAMYSVPVGLYIGARQQYQPVGEAILWPPGDVLEPPTDYIAGTDCFGWSVCHSF